MAVIQFLQYLFHDGFTEEDGFCAHTKLFTILIYSLHLLVIQIDDLPVTTDKSRPLLLEIFGIYALGYFLFTGHGGKLIVNNSENLRKGSKLFITIVFPAQGPRIFPCRRWQSFAVLHGKCRLSEEHI